MPRIVAPVLVSMMLALAACNSGAPAQSPSGSQPSSQGAIGEASPRRPRPASERRDLATDESGPKSAKGETNTKTTPGAFPRHDAKTALRAAEGGLRSCRLGHDAWEVEVAVRFEPAGSVSNVDLTPMRGSKDTELFKTFAACVKERLAEVTVASFSGNAVTMTVPMSL